MESGSTGKSGPLVNVGEKIMAIDVPGLTQIRHWLARESMPNIFEIMMASMNIMQEQITELHLRAEPPDMLIRPKIGHVRFMDFHRADEAILEGYKATMSCLDEIKDAGVPLW